MMTPAGEAILAVALLVFGVGLGWSRARAMAPFAAMGGERKGQPLHVGGGLEGGGSRRESCVSLESIMAISLKLMSGQPIRRRGMMVRCLIPLRRCGTQSAHLVRDAERLGRPRIGNCAVAGPHEPREHAAGQA